MNHYGILSRARSAHGHRQRGAAAVEFALLAGFLFTLLFGVIEMSRVLFYWNTATEATRLGARLAVVCAPSDEQIVKERMQKMLGVLKDNDDIKIDYLDVSSNDCKSTPSTCRTVTVSITGVTVSTLIPLVPLTLTMPPFTTTLPRESMCSCSYEGSTEKPDCNIPKTAND